MQNFDFLSPTKIIFGKGTEDRVGEEVRKYSKKILLHYGGGSIKKTGLYNKIIQSLEKENIEFIELGGVKPNPRLSLVHEGIKLCRENNINFILAVGGGSVIDSAKAIGIGVPYSGEVWDFYAGKSTPQETIPVGVVLTMAAAGSEASKSSVITNEDGWFKVGLSCELTRPKFAIMNPELTFTLPPYQTACGVVDIMAHIMERYFTTVDNVDLTDRLCEAALKTMIANAPIAIQNPKDYNARAEIMWTSTLAHNDLLSTGRIGDWSSHKIEHELSALYDIAHGAGLAVIFPAWMKYVYKKNIKKFVQFAVRVWNVEYDFDFPEKTVLEAINKLMGFFKDLGMPVSLKELNIEDDRFEEMAHKATKSDTISLGNFIKLNKNDVINILKLAK